MINELDFSVAYTKIETSSAQSQAKIACENKFQRSNSPLKSTIGSKLPHTHRMDKSQQWKVYTSTI